MAAPGEDVYCTLVMSDSYLPGAAVLAHSLRDAGTKKRLAALVTLDTLAADTLTELKSLYDFLIPVDRIRNPNPANLYLMDRADLAFAFTKINLWRQIQFRKIVYLDADIVVLRAPDELFDIEAPFAAAPDVGWPDAFNTGVMVLTPNMGDYWALQTMAATGDSFDGADQGLLNQYYEHKGWHRISFTYNCTPNAQYQWEPAYRYYKRDISMVHFIGKDKPWFKGRQSTGSGVYNELLGRWWSTYDRHLKRPTQQYVPTTRPARSSTAIQQHVRGERTSVDFGTQSWGPVQHDAEPETPVTSTERPLSEPFEYHETVQPSITEQHREPRQPQQPQQPQQHHQHHQHHQPHQPQQHWPPSATEQPAVTEQPPPAPERTFSPPRMEWDATRTAPPLESKPEAANFPSQTYEFSGSRKLFQAPQEYPEPPKDMWYDVPKTKPKVEEQPRAIFPWELDRERPKPTRVFAEDLLPSPEPPRMPLLPSRSSQVSQVSQALHQDPQLASQQASQSPQGEVGEDGYEAAQLRESIPSPPPPVSWEEFTQRPNAWDEVPGIETYVRAIMDQQVRRGKPQVLNLGGAAETVGSPTMTRGDRRESLILTDFPSAVERPSLPVTPAPIRRAPFWGEDGDAAGSLPAAEGVPDQAEWDPEKQLNELRRSSILEFEHLRSPETMEKKAPDREMPEHAVPLPHEPKSLAQQPEEELTLADGNGVKPVEQEESSALPMEHAEGGPVLADSGPASLANAGNPPADFGKPVFTAPDFAVRKAADDTSNDLSDGVLSPGDTTEKEKGITAGLFKAESITNADLISPTER